MVSGVTPVGVATVCKRNPPGDVKVRLSTAFRAWPAGCRVCTEVRLSQVFRNGSQVNSTRGFAGLHKVSGGVLAAKS